MIMIIEQTADYRKRMLYIPETASFKETEWDSLAFARGFPFPYGWLKDTGTPPAPHLDQSAGQRSL